LVKVIAENTLTGDKKLANEAFFTFVALDEDGNPCPVPVLSLETDEEKALNIEATNRRNKRLELKQKI
jgi:acyl-CoA hydrolase